MKVFASTLLFLFLGVHAVSAQVSQDTDKKQEPPSSNQTAVNTQEKKEDTAITIELVGGGRLQVEELRETRDGIWYRRGGVTTLLDAARVVRIERPGEPKQVIDPVQNWSLADAKKVENFFFTKFGRPLPTSAFGQSEIHDRWGLDHRQGMDVGLHPDSEEGIALVNFLRTEKIPFLVFRHAIPGVATGPHIHIGRPSHRYLRP